MISLGIKDYVIGGLAIALGLSLWGNTHLSAKVDEANVQIGVSQGDAQTAKEVAKSCSMSVTRLEEEQRAREEKAEPEKVASVATDKKQQARAQVILAKPPTVPGNDCQSAKDRMAGWLKENAK